MTIEECKELGGKALKVVFAKGDSFGDRQARVANWKPFVSLQFNAFNPAQQKVPLTLTVKHKRTTSFQTRVDFPFTLNPGKNEVKIGIDELMNVNGSAPDLSAVGKWYFACAEGATPTLYFGDIWLVGDDLPAAPAAGGAAAVAGPAPVYHIKGTIGQRRRSISRRRPRALSPAAPAKKATIGGDPARLARIRAAKMPPITKPILFCTPEADAICSALEVFPADNPWNQVVSDWPLHPNSKNIIASIGAQKPLRYNADMGFILVPPDQPRVEVKIVDYPGESDKGPFPVPDNTPIEGWPGRLSAAGVRQVADAGRRAARRAQAGRRPARQRRRSGQSDALRILPDEEDRPRLAGRAVLDLRSEVEPAPARRLDLDRRRRAADLPGHGAVRRDPAGHRRARPARDGGQDPPGLRGARHALCQPA